MDAKSFIQSLPPTYWSQNHPSTYTLRFDNRTIGIGVLAPRCFGTWNLIHNKFDWTSFKGHEMGVLAWPLIARALTVEAHGAPLADTVVALGPKQWPIWWKANRQSLPPECRTPIDHATGWAVVPAKTKGAV
jgi:hypothetical protein